MAIACYVKLENTIITPHKHLVSIVLLTLFPQQVVDCASAMWDTREPMEVCARCAPLTHTKTQLALQRAHPVGMDPPQHQAALQIHLVCVKGDLLAIPRVLRVCLALIKQFWEVHCVRPVKKTHPL